MKQQINQQHHQANSKIEESSIVKVEKTKLRRRRGGDIKMSFIIVSLLALLVSISAFSTRTSDAKPMNPNQVRFRRLPPREFSASLGSSITIECEAGASPPPTIHWLKNGNRLQQTNQLDENLLNDDSQQSLINSAIPIDDINRVALSSTRSRLFIDCADIEDEATYTCVAENTYSRVASNTKLNIIRPLAMSSSGNTIGTEQTNALDLPAAAAAAAEVSADADSSLSAIPQCLSQRNSRSSEPARIHMWTHNIIEIMKNDVVLYCRSNIRRQTTTAAAKQQQQQTLAELISNKLASVVTSSKPTTASSSTNTISWTLPDDKIVDYEQHKDKYEVLETGDLLIKDLRWEDMGSYVCTVTNELGSDSVSTFVYPASIKSVKSKRAILMNSQT